MKVGLEVNIQEPLPVAAVACSVVFTDINNCLRF